MTVISKYVMMKCVIKGLYLFAMIKKNYFHGQKNNLETKLQKMAWVCQL